MCQRTVKIRTLAYISMSLYTRISPTKHPRVRPHIVDMSSFFFQTLLEGFEVGDGISASSAFRRMVGYIGVYSSANICSCWSMSVDDMNGNSTLLNFSLMFLSSHSFHPFLPCRMHNTDHERIAIRAVLKRGMYVFYNSRFSQDIFFVLSAWPSKAEGCHQAEAFTEAKSSWRPLQDSETRRHVLWSRL